MLFRLYFRRSFKHYRLYYLFVALIIMVSMITINIVNIYFDSVINGWRLDAIDVSKGYHYWLVGADEDDIPYFSNIPKAELKYEDNIIYIKLLNNNYAETVRKTISDINVDNGLNLQFRIFTNLLIDYVDNNMNAVFNIIKFVVAIIGAVSIYFIYGIFIYKKKNDIGIFISLGIKSKHLRQLLMLELAVLYSLSYIAALVFSNVFMKLLIKHFLYLSNKYLTFADVTYIFSFKSSLLLLVLSLLSVSAAFYINYKKIISDSVNGIINAPQDAPGFNRKANIWRHDSPIYYLTVANTLRNRRNFLGCILNALPFIVIGIVITNFAVLGSTPEEVSDFTVAITPPDANGSRDTVYADIDRLNAVQGVRCIGYFNSDANYYTPIDPDKTLLGYSVSTFYNDNGADNFTKTDYYRSYVAVLPEYYPDGEPYAYMGDTGLLQKQDHVLLPEELNKRGYNIGDKIDLLYQRDHIATLTVAGFTDYPVNAGVIVFYATMENYEKLTRKPTVPSKIDIFTGEAADIDNIRANISAIFSDTDRYFVHDNIKQGEDSLKVFRGMSFVASFICAALSVSAVMSLYFYITFFVMAQKQEISVLSILGAKRAQIVKITVYEALIKGASIAAAGVLLGIPLTGAALLGSGYAIPVNLNMVITYGLIIAATVAANVLPAYIAISKMTAERSVRQ